MVRMLSVCAGMAIAASAASAAFVGIELRTNPAWNTSANAAIGGVNTHTVVRMYAAFDAPDTVLSVGQVTGDFGFGLVQPGTSFFQAPGGGVTSPNSGLFGPVPSLQWDTYVSINRLTNDSGDTTAVDGSFAFIDTSGDTQHDFVSGGWFNSSPANLQGQTSFNAGLNRHETFLGQFTIRNFVGTAVGANPSTTVENLFVSGELTVFTQVPGGGALENTVSFIAVPAPGTLAALGLLGLASARRRRLA